MKQEVKAELIERLRSGEFKQGKGDLTSLAGPGGPRHCIGGVLCEIAAGHGVVSRSPVPKGKLMGYKTPGSRLVKTSFPPPEVLLWAGLSANRMWELTDLNDQNMNFYVLADSIERND
jgi:hypothetical protein